MRTIALFFIYLLWLGSAYGSFGLDERPSNPACVSPERPKTEFGAMAEKAFPNLSFNLPISMSQPPGDSSRWLLAERTGFFYSFDNLTSTNEKTLILDIANRMQFTDMVGFTDSQQWGVTGFSLHPNFPAQPYIYIAYNAKPGETGPLYSYVSRFTSNDGGQTFDPASESILLSRVQDSPWHHLGQVLFGPDGYLYIGMGNGGCNNKCAQDLTKIRGKILRIDVDNGSPYAIPPDNPYAGTAFREEIFASGLRNPWRFTFDRSTGDLWAGDVGGALWEEVDFIQAGGNYGWPILEGTHCFNATVCDDTDMIPPVIEFDHSVGRVVMGGYVYRGSAIPPLQGTYLFGAADSIYGIVYSTSGQPSMEMFFRVPRGLPGFAEANDGELYLFSSKGEFIYKMTPTSGSAPAPTFPALLSATGCVDPSTPTTPAPGLIPYDVNTPLWSDGAEKSRWMALPDGTTIDLNADKDFEFPIGTVLMKEFAFNGAPFETRLFVRHADGGWAGYSYEWRDDLSDADLLPAGKTRVLPNGVTWRFPSRNECLRCHTDVVGFSIGPEVNQLNDSYLYSSSGLESNQLRTLEHIGMFTASLPDVTQNLPALAPIESASVPVARRARSYLHHNCSVCHRPGGPVQSSMDFRFSTPIENMNICNAAPQHGDTGVPGARILKPGDPTLSLISIRIHSLGINRMPPLGTGIVDGDGARVIDDWIAQPDVCAVYPDDDADGTMDNIDNCTGRANASQYDSDVDGYGNLCDPDLNNDGTVDSADLARMKAMFFGADADADLDGNGTVSSGDLAIMKSMFFRSPGPSAIAP